MRLVLSEEDIKQLKQIGKQYPNLLEMLDRLRSAELENMALTTTDHFSTFKGRVQMLTELRQHFRS